MQPSSGYGGIGLGLGPFQQRQLMSHSLHASNPAISQYYQQQHQPSASSAAALAYNLQQQFAGSHHYGSGGQPPLGHSHIQASVQQQMHPQYQYHVHQHQNHLQTHPLASLANTSGTFGGTLASSARDAVAGGAYEGLHHSHPHHSHSHLHPHSHHHHSAYPHSHSHHQQQPHHHHHLPYSKLDLDYPKLPQEHKRQVSFKFDTDTLSLDS
ncbi:GL15294 [Drosophila persimilis]|uniref:GL15294 n=1 Tax=Drosophila persimilis TaxID=7234 RepID=B4IS16_DROPE|nr:GL15294 [Drosophila persimilis]